MNFLKRIYYRITGNKINYEYIIVIIATMIFYFISSSYDFFEGFYDIISHSSAEKYQLDEIVMALLFFLIMITILAIKHLVSTIKYNKKLKDISFIDDLTNIPNRRAFFTFAKQNFHMAKLFNQKMALIYIDLNRFKIINDTLGHHIGDQLLVEIASRLQEHIREYELSARLGGDEYVLLMYIDSMESLNSRIDALNKSFKEPFVCKNNPIIINPSIGVSIYPEHGENVEELLQHADTAMYINKENQSLPYVIYHEDMRNSVLKNKILEYDLIKAIEKKSFEIYYQPQLNLKTMQIDVMEALIRWNHPEKGIILPAEFIALAEKSGLIIDIGKWVLEEACRQVKTWQDKGYPNICVAVNISARQLNETDFPSMVAQTLKEVNLDPIYLILEVTETLAVNLSEEIIMALNEITNMGVQIHIDDFGSGYSSMSYLKDFPVSCLKVDKSFIDNVHTNPKDDIIISAIIAMAHNLELSVIAEGVEKRNQLRFLVNRNCDSVQGYYISKPIPAKQFEEIYMVKNGLEGVDL